jgi:prepilin-type N-terminal cleavage/methylation domain-containing protein
MPTYHAAAARPRWPPWTTGFSIIELLIVITVFSTLSLLSWPRVSQVIAHSRVNQAAKVVAHDLTVAGSAAARQRRPVRVALDAGGRSFTVSDRVSGNALWQRSLGRDTEYGVDSVSFSANPVDLLPGGFTSSALTVGVWGRGYSRAVTMSRAGWVRVR